MAPFFSALKKSIGLSFILKARQMVEVGCSGVSMINDRSSFILVRERTKNLNDLDKLE
jgi:hypothetical protein